MTSLWVLVPVAVVGWALVLYGAYRVVTWLWKDEEHE